jgi:hypothetical protein
MPDLVRDLVAITFRWESFDVTVILTKPILDGKKTYLTKRTCHSFLNMRPVDIQARIKSVFFELYGEFKVAEKSMPFVLMHMETEDHDSYELRL